MQLSRSVLVLPFFMVLCGMTWGQPLDSVNSIEPVTIDFLVGYYEQDGNHSAVTGGKGTEELEDRDFKLVLNIPLDSVSRLVVDANVNYYTSASTDNIDSHVSSASSEDLRSQFSFSYEKETSPGGNVYGFGLGGSTESDYLSTSFKGYWSRVSEQGGRQLSLSAQLFFDRWVMIFPEELRKEGTLLPTVDKRNSYQLSASYTQVINQRLKCNLSMGLGYQKGLLSTPFHRVFFMGQEDARVERLPGDRWKFPLAMRIAYFWGDFLVFKGHHRYYADGFGVRSHTSGVETRWKLSPFLTFYPFYRYHTQGAAAYFHPFKEHHLSDRYYTSDYDLSDFDSHKYGVGVHWAPLYGIGGAHRRKKKWTVQFKSIGLRYASYQRSDGLRAKSLSTAIRINID